jgi:hypothetical protein
MNTGDDVWFQLAGARRGQQFVSAVALMAVAVLLSFLQSARTDYPATSRAGPRAAQQHASTLS